MAGLRPEVAAGDGAMGFWAGLEEVFSTTRQQRCLVHETANVLNALPKASQKKAKQGSDDVWQAETKADAQKAFDDFIERYEGKYPKMTNKLQHDWEALMAFFDFPAKHCQSLCTSNPIESTFGTIRH